MAPVDILVVICDTARSDAFSPWGSRARTPATEALSGSGLTFGAALAPAPWTLPSVASILTGELPTEHWISADSLAASSGPGEELATHGDVRPSPDELTSLALAVAARAGSWLPEALRSRGYRTWAASCNPWISTWNGFDRGFDRFEDVRVSSALPRSKVGLAARRVRQAAGLVDHGGRDALERFFGFLRQVGDAPWFALLELMELHDPYDPPLRFPPLLGHTASARDRLRAPGWLRRQLRQRSFRGRPDPLYLRTIRELYYAAAEYEDHLVGRLIGAVRERGRPTVVVLVSDHGEHLGEGGLFEHHSSLAEPLLRVPLVVWESAGGYPTGRVEEPFPIQALGPWLAEVADGHTEPPSPPEAVVSEYESTVRRPGGIRLRPDLRRLLASGRALPPLALHPGIAVRKGNRKFVAVEGEADAVFDLGTDPGEEHDVVRWRPDASAEFAPYRRAWERRRAAPSIPAPGPKADAEIEAHLRSLGYLE